MHGKSGLCRRWHTGVRPAHIPTRILVADSHAGTRDTLAATLSLDGYFVATAEDGVSTLLSTWSFAPDLLVVDTTLAGIPGAEVIRRLRAGGFYKPAIALTCSPFDTDPQVYRDAGFDALCTKATDFVHLLAMIRELTDSNPLEHRLVAATRSGETVH